MARSLRLALLAVALCASPLALAQPFNFTTEPFEPDMTEPQMRRASNYTGFLFSFDTVRPAVGDETPNGNIRQNQASTNPFLSTLPGDGNGQTLVTLGPCAGNTPHTHPRGSEISFLLYGEIEFGMVDENPNNNTLILRNMTQNETINVPQGVLHFSHNYNCEPAAFLANFATKDPGTQTMWGSMMKVPTNILNSATGIPETTIEMLKTYPIVSAPGTGGEECLRRCRLGSFESLNHLVPISELPPPNTGVSG